MKTVQRYFSERLGRRGTLLALFGLGYGLYGVGQFSAAPTTRFGELGPIVTEVLNSHAIGWLWIVGGSIGFVVGLRPRRQSDGLGFAAVLIPLVVWIALYGLSWVAGLVTDDVYGNSEAWVTTVVWVVFAAVILVAAGWPDPATVDGPDGLEGGPGE